MTNQIRKPKKKKLKLLGSGGPSRYKLHSELLQMRQTAHSLSEKEKMKEYLNKPFGLGKMGAIA